MIGNLTDNQIDTLLKKEVIGRIGCATDDNLYVVPISYVYDGKNIYAHTYEGLKTKAMRKNPKVCFEVDDIKDLANWSSVIAWGTYNEITEKKERNEALKLLLDRHLPVASSVTTHLGKSWPFYNDELDSIDGIVFKIALNSRTGKFESSTNSPIITG